MGKIIVIGSQKGGVGKTTTTLNLAHSLQQMGKKVLTVDFDSQANLTTCYGVEDTGALEYTIGHLMMAQIEEEVPESFEDYIQSRECVDYIPSSIYLSVVDAKLRTEMGAERMLADVLEPLKSRYDYILIDTCPSLGMLTINALAAADEVIITVNTQLLAMMGLQDFLLCKFSICNSCRCLFAVLSNRHIVINALSDLDRCRYPCIKYSDFSPEAFGHFLCQNLAKRCSALTHG